MAIVLELANENILDEEEAIDHDLKEERNEQIEAIEFVTGQYDLLYSIRKVG